jgi:hypothetical protein
MLASAIQHIVSRVEDESIHKGVKRIIQIWSERQIYQPDAIKLLKTSYENGVKDFFFVQDFYIICFNILDSKKRFR